MLFSKKADLDKILIKRFYHHGVNEDIPLVTHDEVFNI